MPSKTGLIEIHVLLTQQTGLLHLALSEAVNNYENFDSDNVIIKSVKNPFYSIYRKKLLFN